MQAGVRSVEFAATTRITEASETRSFSILYERWFDHACRWLPAMGVNDADVEDVVQDLFVVVRAKLDKFDGANVGGWLYGIALRLASNHRRKTWLRQLFFRADEKQMLAAIDCGASPLELLESREKNALLDRLLAQMSDKRRRALVLYEVEGYSGEEIAALEGIPLATVWTRQQ